MNQHSSTSTTTLLTPSEAVAAAKREKEDYDLSWVPGAIASYGLDFLIAPDCISHPKYGLQGLSEDRSELRDLQFKAHTFIAKATDTRYAYAQVFEAVYGSSLKVDEFSGTVYLGGSKVDDVSDLTHRLAGIIDRLPPTQDVFQTSYNRMLRHRFVNPITAYLEGLAAPRHESHWDAEEGWTKTQLPPTTPDTWPEFQQLAKHAFGDQATALDQTLLTRWLIATVARAVEPGCQADSVLVIKGAQGVGKTSFFRSLGTIPNVLSSRGDAVSRFGTLLPKKTQETQQEIQKLWIAEMGEVESTFRAKDISELKAFLTLTEDLYRAPYAAEPTSHPRHTSFCATTNQDGFLTDSTGSRRFWVIDVGNNPINLDWVQANLDNIWACAYHLYRKGEPWHLSADEADLSEARNEQYAASSGYEDTLTPFLTELEAQGSDRNVSYTLNPADILSVLLAVPPAQHQKYYRKLGETMRELGYSRKMFSVNGKKTRRYYKEDSELPMEHIGTDTVHLIKQRSH